MPEANPRAVFALEQFSEQVTRWENGEITDDEFHWLIKEILRNYRKEQTK